SLLSRGSGNQTIWNFYKNTFQAIKDSKLFWIHQKGAQLNEVKGYSCNFKFENGRSQMIK
ncbi:hypothetical protein, partial [Polaribacter sp.]|uniref:hypothetical protein n=1 Tax=Polaribacter sp. TaxID=1920175 RepID=UPI003EEE864E